MGLASGSDLTVRIVSTIFMYSMLRRQRTWSRVLTIAKNVSNVATLTDSMRVFVNTSCTKSQAENDNAGLIHLLQLSGTTRLALLRSR